MESLSPSDQSFIDIISDWDESSPLQNLGGRSPELITKIAIASTPHHTEDELLLCIDRVEWISSLSHQTVQKIQSLKKLLNSTHEASRSDFETHLGLDDWNAGPDTQKAKNRIIESFINKSKFLDLSDLKLTSLPECVKHFIHLKKFSYSSESISKPPSLRLIVKMKEINSFHKDVSLETWTSEEINAGLEEFLSDYELYDYKYCRFPCAVDEDEAIAYYEHQERLIGYPGLELLDKEDYATYSREDEIDTFFRPSTFIPVERYEGYETFGAGDSNSQKDWFASYFHLASAPIPEPPAEPAFPKILRSLSIDQISKLDPKYIPLLPITLANHFKFLAPEQFSNLTIFQLEHLNFTELSQEQIDLIATPKNIQYLMKNSDFIARVSPESINAFIHTVLTKQSYGAELFLIKLTQTQVAGINFNDLSLELITHILQHIEKKHLTEEQIDVLSTPQRIVLLGEFRDLVGKIRGDLLNGFLKSLTADSLKDYYSNEIRLILKLSPAQIKMIDFASLTQLQKELLFSRIDPNSLTQDQADSLLTIKSIGRSQDPRAFLAKVSREAIQRLLESIETPSREDYSFLRLLEFSNAHIRFETLSSNQIDCVLCHISPYLLSAEQMDTLSTSDRIYALRHYAAFIRRVPLQKIITLLKSLREGDSKGSEFLKHLTGEQLEQIRFDELTPYQIRIAADVINFRALTPYQIHCLSTPEIIYSLRMYPMFLSRLSDELINRFFQSPEFKSIEDYSFISNLTKAQLRSIPFYEFGQDLIDKLSTPSEIKALKESLSFLHRVKPEFLNPFLQTLNESDPRDFQFLATLTAAQINQIDPKYLQFLPARRFQELSQPTLITLLDSPLKATVALASDILIRNLRNGTISEDGPLGQKILSKYILSHDNPYNLKNPFVVYAKTKLSRAASAEMALPIRPIGGIDGKGFCLNFQDIRATSDGLIQSWTYKELEEAFSAPMISTEEIHSWFASLGARKTEIDAFLAESGLRSLTDLEKILCDYDQCGKWIKTGAPSERVPDQTVQFHACMRSLLGRAISSHRAGSDILTNEEFGLLQFANSFWKCPGGRIEQLRILFGMTKEVLPAPFTEKSNEVPYMNKYLYNIYSDLVTRRIERIGNTHEGLYILNKIGFRIGLQNRDLVFDDSTGMISTELINMTTEELFEKIAHLISLDDLVDAVNAKLNQDLQDGSPLEGKLGESLGYVFTSPESGGMYYKSEFLQAPEGLPLVTRKGTIEVLKKFSLLKEFDHESGIEPYLSPPLK